VVERIGSRRRLAFDLHPVSLAHPSMRVVDIWLRGRLLTEHDNTVYVPQFLHSVRRDLDAVQTDGRFTPPFGATLPLVDQFDALHATDDGRREANSLAN
jgi:hypothetical protein